MKQEHEITVEYQRVRDMLSDSIREIEAAGGNVYLFAAGLLRAAFEMHLELHGPGSLDQAVSGIATRLLLAERGVARC